MSCILRRTVEHASLLPEVKPTSAHASSLIIFLAATVHGVPVHADPITEKRLEVRLGQHRAIGDTNLHSELPSALSRSGSKTRSRAAAPSRLPFGKARPPVSDRYRIACGDPHRRGGAQHFVGPSRGGRPQAGLWWLVLRQTSRLVRGGCRHPLLWPRGRSA